MFAQDTIYTYKKQKIAAKIIEITKGQVAFKLSHNIDSTEYYLAKDEIAVIVYQDGKFESFGTKKIYKRNFSRSKTDSLILGRNLLSMNVADVMFGQLTVNYERFFKSGFFSFKIPFSFGLYQLSGGNRISNDDMIYYSLNKIGSTGFDFYYYPYNQGHSKLYLGPSIEFGAYRDIRYYREVYTSDQVLTNRKIYQYATFLFQTGVLFAPTNKFQIATSMGIGRNFDKNRRKIALRLGLNVGYRF
jgi:hypothetical protein